MPTRSLRAVAAAAALLLPLAACGDDDGDDAATAATEAESADFDAEAFCAAADVLGNAEAPTPEQISAYQDAAPAEIEDDVEVVATAFNEALESEDFSGLAEPEVIEATEGLQAAELEHCGVVAGEE
jgi:hypothetical protein